MKRSNIPLTLSAARFLTVPVFGILCCFSFLGAQKNPGTIEGVVTDPTGIEIAGVQVIITEQNTGVRRTLVTSESGFYCARNLLPGTYQVVASKPTFKNAKSDGLVLQAAQTILKDLVLNIGDLSEIVVQPGAGSLLEAANAAAGKTYYVNSDSGSDEKSGLSMEEAWASLSKVNCSVFEPGDRILFKAGSRFGGRLKPQGSGYRGRPIIVDIYGKGDKPLIAAEGEFDEALLLENQEYWEVNNLRLTNTGPTRELFRSGIRVRVSDFGTMRHIHLKDLWVHDVNGSLKKGEGEGYGILLENGGEKVKSRFDGVLIEGCHVIRADHNGICGLAAYSPDEAKAFPNLNVVIRNNLVENIGGDGIKLSGCFEEVVEQNIIR